MPRLLPLLLPLLLTQTNAPLSEVPEETTAQTYDSAKSHLGISSAYSDSFLASPFRVIARCPVHGPLISGDLLIFQGTKIPNRRYCIKCIVEFLDKSVPEVEEMSEEKPE